MSLTDWLVSYWKFDEGSWTTAFDSVGTNDWSLTNSSLWDSNGKIWSAINKTSWSEYAFFPRNLWTWNFTVSFWWKPDDVNFSVWYWHFTNINDWGTNYLYFRQNWVWGNQARLSVRNISVSTIDFIHWNFNINLNEYNYITIVRSWTNIKTYHNATLRTDVTNNINAANLTNWFYIWARPDPNFTSISNIDEVWIWNRALTSTEISELYNNWDGLQYPFTTPTTKKWNIFFWFWA